MYSQYEQELHSLRHRLAGMSEDKHQLEDRLSAADAAHRLSQGQAAQLQVGLCILSPLSVLFFHSGEQRMQKLKSHLMRTQSLNVVPLQPGVGQYIAKHAMLTAREFFLANFYPSGPFTCIFSKISSEFFLC